MCSVNERWAHSLLENQSEYLVAISRFEVPMNKVPITRELTGAIEIYRYHDQLNQHNLATFLAVPPPYPTHIRVDAPASMDEMMDYSVAAGGGGALPPGEWITFPVQGPHNFRNIESLFAGSDLENYNHIRQYLDNLENIPASKASSIDIPPCHTLYEFLQTLNAKIKEALLHGNGEGFTPNTIVAYKGLHPTDDRMAFTEAAEAKTPEFPRHNVFSSNERAKCDDEPIANFRIEMSSDYRFSIYMNSTFTRNYYIKLHPELFKMMQFREQNNTGEGQAWDRTWLTGRRFMGDREPDVDNNNMISSQFQHTPPFQNHMRSFRMKRYLRSNATMQSNPPAYSSEVSQSDYGLHAYLDTNYLNGLNIIDMFEMTLDERVVTFTAGTSAADSINRVKSIVFTSSLATKSEGQSGNTYRRILTDFTVPVDSEFSWNPNTFQSGNITEGAAAELTYASENPSSGRLLIMTDPSPLYEISIQVMAKCWNFEHEAFTFEPIPLPQGSTFTCKLVFISKNDIYHDHEQRPDKLKG